MINWILFAIVVILQGLDAWSTALALKKPGIIEGNKLVAWMMNRIGVLPALLIIKTLFCGALAGAVFYAPSVYLTVMLAAVIAAYGVIVVNNFRKG